MRTVIARLRWMLRPRRNVPVGRFDVTTNKWADVTVDADSTRDDLTLATYNIWLSGHHSDERYGAIAQMLSEHSPDVVVFQEVTPRALAAFLAQPWIRERYYRAAVTGNEFGDYGQLILSRLPISRVTYTHLPTSIGRGLLQAELTVNGRALAICSVHLESGRRASRLRARQVDRVFSAVGAAEDVVLCGDFNMRDDEDGRIPNSYVDAWPTLHPNEEGFTEDTSVNLMLLDSKKKNRRVRFDRVLIKGDGWTPALIRLLGTEPVSSTLPRVFPSDHFGLLCRVVRTAAQRSMHG